MLLVYVKNYEIEERSNIYTYDEIFLCCRPCCEAFSDNGEEVREGVRLREIIAIFTRRLIINQTLEEVASERLCKYERAG